jgi:hypothetical protein
MLWGDGRGQMFSRRLMASIIATAALLLVCAATAGAQSPLETVHLQKIALGSEVENASQPVYTTDGEHLLFAGNVVANGNLNPDPNRGPFHLWMVGTNGQKPHCITCGLSNEPLVGEAEQPGLIQPFPDGKRVMYGPYGVPTVLECTPTVVNCKHAQIFPVDLSGAFAPGGLIFPGGANGFAFDTGGAASPKLSPDGNYIAFSDVRTDSIEEMVLAKLGKEGEKYVVSQPRVLNPAGPTSPTDPNTGAWSDSAGLFEFKTFVEGGRAVTYVQVGGNENGGINLWKLDLQTGQRTQLTSYPEWEEDMAVSPDGKSMLVGIDSQTRHYMDFAGLLPFRGFFGAVEGADIAISHVSSAKLRSCAPFSSALLPASGDQNGNLVGQIVDPYEGGEIRDSGDINGWPQWSPNSTSVALSTQSFATLAGAPYLLVAHLSRKPTEPLPIVSSEPGSWAPGVQEYHGAIGSEAEVTLKGVASGQVRVHEGNPFFGGSGDLSATYENYSEDGESFVNGTQNIVGGTITNNITMSGAHTGSLHGEVTYLGPGAYHGSQTATYDGTTVSGPASQEELCEQIRSVLPGKGKLNVVANLSQNKVIVTVTSAQAGAGRDETGTDVRPVNGATVTYADGKATTNQEGVAVLPPKAQGEAIQIEAGDTFQPAAIKAP